MTKPLFANPASVVAREEFLAWAEGGEYYKSCHTTPGTAIATSILTSFSATNAAMVAVWGSSAKCMIPHYLRLICTTAPASATSSHLSIAIDTINRYSSGGTDITAMVKNARSDDTTASALTGLYFGGITAAAASAPRYLARTVIKTQSAPDITVGDEITINFLGKGDVSPGLISGAGTVSITKNVGPVILAASATSLLFHLWNPGNASTAPQWEFEFAWFERPLPG